MKYFEELDHINQEIIIIREHCDYLLNNMGEIERDNNNYLKELNRRLEPGNIGYNSICTKETLRREIAELQNDVLKLKDRREEVIRIILNASKISVQDAIYLMDKFGAYHRIETIDNKAYIVPQDFYLLKSGYNSVISEEELKEISCQYNAVGNPVKKSASSIPMYQYKPCEEQVQNGHITTFTTKLNDQILMAVAGLEIEGCGGIQIYKRGNNEVVFNEKILNLFPYDVIAFLDYFVSNRLENPKVTIDEAWKQYNKDTKVLVFSKEDPALEDIYRKVR